MLTQISALLFESMSENLQIPANNSYILIFYIFSQGYSHESPKASFLNSTQCHFQYTCFVINLLSINDNVTVQTTPVYSHHKIQ